MSFDMTCDGSTSQQEFFDRSGIKTMLNAALDGYAATVFAYGQTGSGKTYTMSGLDEKLDRKGKGGHAPTDDDITLISEESGLVPRSFQYLTEEIARRESSKPGLKYFLRASYMELYNEQLRDLLNLNSEELMIRQRSIPGSDVASFFVQGLTVVNCELGAADLHAVALEGHKNRTVASHNLNEDSSRSHSILTVYVECRYQEQDESGEMDGSASGKGGEAIQWVRYGKISFIDLAGSENLKTSGITGGEHLKETANINKSLFALGTVISTLGDISTGKKSKNTFVPYRNSKLTMLLADSLGGRALTMMIACASPAAASVEETKRTLAYAATTRNIQNKPEIAVDPRTKLLLRFKEECDRLKAENMALRQFISQHGLQLPLELVATEGAPPNNPAGNANPEEGSSGQQATAAGASSTALVPNSGFPSAVGIQENGLVSSAYAFSSSNTGLTTATGLQIGSALTAAQAEALMRDNALLRSRIGNLLAAFANGDPLDQFYPPSSGFSRSSSSISGAPQMQDITDEVLPPNNLLPRSQSSLIDYDSMINKRTSASNDKFILKMYNERLQKNVARLQKRETELISQAKALQDQVTALQSMLAKSGIDIPQSLMTTPTVLSTPNTPGSQIPRGSASGDKGYVAAGAGTPTSSPSAVLMDLGHVVPATPPPGFPAFHANQPVIVHRSGGSARRTVGHAPPSPSLSSAGGGPSIRAVIPGLSDPVPGHADQADSETASTGSSVVGSLPHVNTYPQRVQSGSRVPDGVRPTRLAGELVISGSPPSATSTSSASSSFSSIPSLPSSFSSPSLPSWKAK